MTCDGRYTRSASPVPSSKYKHESPFLPDVPSLAVCRAGKNAGPAAMDLGRYPRGVAQGKSLISGGRGHGFLRYNLEFLTPALTCLGECRAKDEKEHFPGIFHLLAGLGKAD